MEIFQTISFYIIFRYSRFQFQQLLKKMGTMVSKQFFNEISTNDKNIIDKVMLKYEKDQQLSSLRVVQDQIQYQVQEEKFQVNLFNVTTSAQSFMKLKQNPSLLDIFTSLSQRTNISVQEIQNIYEMIFLKTQVEKGRLNKTSPPLVNKKLYFTLEYILLHEQIVDEFPYAAIFLKIDYDFSGVLKVKKLCQLFQDEYNISEDKVLLAIGCSKIGCISFQSYLNAYYRIYNILN